MTRYWCHICNSFVHVQQNPILCSTCGGEFVEVVPDEPAAAVAQAATIPQDGPFAQQAQLDANNPLGSLFGMLSNMLANPNQNGGFVFPAPPPQGPQPQHAHFTFQPNFAAPNAQAFGAGQQMPGNPQPAFVQFGQPPIFNFTAQAGSYAPFPTS